MDLATEIAQRIIPKAGSEWPLSPHGYAIVVGHAANIIQAELLDEFKRLDARIEQLVGELHGKAAKNAMQQARITELEAALTYIKRETSLPSWAAPTPDSYRVSCELAHNMATDALKAVDGGTQIG